MRIAPLYRAALVKQFEASFPDGPKRGAEIGVLAGRTSAKLLEAFPALLLYMVDPWNGVATPDRAGAIGTQASLNLARHHTKQFAGRCVLMQTTSVEAAQRLDDESLDFVFIDADHSYGAVCEDIAAWAPKVRKRGILCGHDYSSVLAGGRPNGVQRAVDEYAASIEVEITLREGWLWFILPGVLTCT